MLVNRLACRLGDLRIRLDQGVFAPALRPAAQRPKPKSRGGSHLQLVASA
jgi:hypothetical protein